MRIVSNVHFIVGVGEVCGESLMLFFLFGVCVLVHRPDLAEACDKHDLDMFRNEFDF